MKKKSWYFLAVDIFILVAAFLISIWIKPATKRVYLPQYSLPFLYFSIIWIASSFSFGKYKIFKEKGLKIFTGVLLSNLLALSVIFILIYGFQLFQYSRLVLFGTIIITTSLELIISTLFYWVSITKDEPELNIRSTKKLFSRKELKHREIKESLSGKEVLIAQEIGPVAFGFISTHVDMGDKNCLVLETTTRFNILKQENNYDCIVNLHRMNDVRFLNKFFEAANSKLNDGGLFITLGETKDQRKNRLHKKYIWGFNKIYYFFDFLIKRVFPKFSWTKRIYFFLTRGENRVLSKAEMLGRLYSCGFEVIDEKEIDGQLYVVVQKTKNPFFDPDPTYGPLIKLRRVGKNGKIIKVYKMRTMHPYAEYLQEYIFQKYDLKKGGKFENDFRISTVGKLMRKLWIDELPMIFNLLRGDLKIVGVRPLSRHYFSLYSEELQKERVKVTPGLIPPFYVHLPKSLEEIMESEMKYLKEYQHAPLKTDIKYFFIAVYNILIKGARSE